MCMRELYHVYERTRSCVGENYRGLAHVKQRLLGRHVSGQLYMAHIGSERR